MAYFTRKDSDQYGQVKNQNFFFPSFGISIPCSLRFNKGPIKQGWSLYLVSSKNESIAITFSYDWCRVNRQVVNCLKLTRSLHSREARMKSLQSLVALHLFAKMANEKVNHLSFHIASCFALHNPGIYWSFELENISMPDRKLRPVMGNCLLLCFPEYHSVKELAQIHSSLMLRENILISVAWVGMNI